MRASDAKRYIRALGLEIARTPPQAIATIFLGGGTPNAYDAETIASLIEQLRTHFPSTRTGKQEISIEINPDAVREGDIDRYASAGINRISIGVQSFLEREVRALGRRHTNAQVERCVAEARAAGIASISLDLMFGLPGQNEEDWSRCLDTAIALGVDHCSTYGLTIEAGTPFGAIYTRSPETFGDEDLQALLYERAMDRFEAAGFEQYEISNFARPGHRCRHNENYWRNGSYIGLGVGAASYMEGRRTSTTRELAKYFEAAESGASIPCESEELSGLRRLGEAMMLALRTSQGVDTRVFNQRYGIDPSSIYSSTIAQLIDDGLLQRTGENLRLTRRGRLLANDVCGAFVTLE